jgi:hypothetical protein
VHWYNVEHKHSGIRYVSPQQRHTGEDHAILAARHVLYTDCQEAQSGTLGTPYTRLEPHRGRSPSTRNVTCIIAEHVAAKLIQPWLRKSGDNYLDVRRLVGPSSIDFKSLVTSDSP